MVQLTPPPQLYSRIIDEIQYRQAAAKIKRKISIWATGLAGSWMAFLILLQNFSRQIRLSGFGPISQLLLSDFGIIKAHLVDYLLSLAEALPIISLSFVALALLIIITSAIKLLASAMELRKLKVR